MKLLVAALTLVLSTPSYASSGWELATRAATAAFRADYKAEKGSEPASDPLGFFLSLGGERLSVTAYYVDGGNGRSFVYACPEEGAEQNNCRLVDRGNGGAYKRSSSKYNGTEMAKAVRLGLELLAEKKVAPRSAVRTLKIWEAEGDLNLRIAHGEKSEQVFIMCHYHGRDFDCHRQRSSGPGEPK